MRETLWVTGRGRGGKTPQPPPQTPPRNPPQPKKPPLRQRSWESLFWHTATIGSCGAYEGGRTEGKNRRSHRALQILMPLKISLGETIRNAAKTETPVAEALRWVTGWSIALRSLQTRGKDPDHRRPSPGKQPIGGTRPPTPQSLADPYILIDIGGKKGTCYSEIHTK